jgi:hypothetical protein
MRMASRLPAIGFAAGATILTAGAIAPAAATTFLEQLNQDRVAQRQIDVPALIVQNAGSQGSPDQVQTAQVDRYIAVYKAMQKDHSLTVGQACAQQGITVAQFRDIENKIERDDQLRAIVRKALNPAGVSASGDDENN